MCCQVVLRYCFPYLNSPIFTLENNLKCNYYTAWYSTLFEGSASNFFWQKVMSLFRA